MAGHLMTDLETIQAAIVKLEMLKAEGTSGPWTAMEYDSNPGDQGVPIIGGGEIGSMEGHLTAYTMTLGSEERSVIDAELIVTLHRTLDAQLAILRAAQDDYNQYGEKPSKFFANDVALARAILGEEH